jgi:DNA-directed RNA polymerase subunit L
MIKIDKINIKLIQQTNNLGDSCLEFNIKGKNINYVIVNTLRRTIFSDIPIYAFDKFKFEKNTSIFHNNYLSLRIRNMPVWGIDNNIDYVENEKKKDKDKSSDILENDEQDFVDFDIDVDKNFNSSTLKQLTMHVNYKNKTNDIINVTTDNAKFYFEEKHINSPYNINIPIIKLQPNQEIIFDAITKLGTEEGNTIYSAVSVNYYKEINDNEFHYVLESRGQLTEKRILLVAIYNIDKRIKNFLKLFNNNDINNINIEEESKLQGVIIINNEDHTLGNLINRGLQQHSDISFSGYNMPHPLLHKVHISFKLKKNIIKNVIEDVVNYYITLFNEIKKQIIEL